MRNIVIEIKIFTQRTKNVIRNENANTDPFIHNLTSHFMNELIRAIRRIRPIVTKMVEPPRPINIST